MNKIFPSLFFDHSVTDLDFWSDQLLGSQGGRGAGGGDVLVRILHVGLQGNKISSAATSSVFQTAPAGPLLHSSPRGLDMTGIFVGVHNLQSPQNAIFKYYQTKSNHSHMLISEII